MSAWFDDLRRSRAYDCGAIEFLKKGQLGEKLKPGDRGMRP
jgi:hypothetical protein